MWSCLGSQERAMGWRQGGQQHAVAEEGVPCTRRTVLPPMPPLTGLGGPFLSVGCARPLGRRAPTKTYLPTSSRRRASEAACRHAGPCPSVKQRAAHCANAGQRSRSTVRASAHAAQYAVPLTRVACERPKPPRPAGRKAMSLAGHAASSAGEPRHACAPSTAGPARSGRAAKSGRRWLRSDAQEVMHEAASFAIPAPPDLRAQHHALLRPRAAELRVGGPHAALGHPEHGSVRISGAQLWMPCPR